MAGYWRLAKSLEQLRAQVNEAYPNRSKASDGTIGDAAHAATASDHNPNPQGVVCAFDITNDPRNGLDAHTLADRLRTNRHPDLKYIISNSRITGAWTGWNWWAYTGVNPHSSHVHISVGEGPDGQSRPGTYDSVAKWNIKEDIMETMTMQELDQALWTASGYQPSQKDLEGWYEGIRKGDSYKTTMKKIIKQFGNDPLSYNYYKRQAEKKIKQLEADLAKARSGEAEKNLNKIKEGLGLK